MTSEFQMGVAARKAGAGFCDFPDSCLDRLTKLGTRVPNCAGIEWQRGWESVQRFAGKLEVEAATRLTDLGQFRSRHRRQQ